MAEDHRIFYDEGPDGAVLPVVDIAAADSGIVYCNEDVEGGFEGWFGSFFEGEGERFVEDEGEVLRSCC